LFCRLTHWRGPRSWSIQWWRPRHDISHTAPYRYNIWVVWVCGQTGRHRHNRFQQVYPVWCDIKPHITILITNIFIINIYINKKWFHYHLWFHMMWNIINSLFMSLTIKMNDHNEQDDHTRKNKIQLVTQYSYTISLSKHYKLYLISFHYSILLYPSSCNFEPLCKN